MIHKYLNLLQQIFESFRHLGRESSWGDYFHTIGLELLILLIGIVAIVTIVIVFVVPYMGTVKINKWFEHRNHLKNIQDFMWEYKSSICAVLNQLWTIKQVKCPQDSQDSKSIYKKLINAKQILSDIGLFNYDSELREQLDNFIKYVESTHTRFDAEYVSDEELKVYDMTQNLENDIFKYCIKWSFTADLKSMEEFDNSSALTNAINACLKEKLNADIDIKDVIRHKFRMQAKQYTTLGLFYAIYAIFVIPLVMMLF